MINQELSCHRKRSNRIVDKEKRDRVKKWSVPGSVVTLSRKESCTQAMK